MKYRVFTNDCGTNLYSPFCDVSAKTLDEARHKAERETMDLSNLQGRELKIIVCPVAAIDETFVSTPDGLKLR